MNQPTNQMQEQAPSYAASPNQAQTPQQEPARLGPVGRLTGALLSPGETFQDVNRKPTVIIPVIIAIVIALVSTLFFSWRVKPDWDQVIRNQIKRSVEKRGAEMPPEEQIQQQVALGKTIAKFSPLLAAVATPIIYLLLAGIFALGLMLMQAQTTFKKIFSVIAWSSCAIGIISTIVTIASLMVRDEESLKDIDPTQSSGLIPSNLGAFLTSESSAVIRSIASSIDIFTIWFLILLTIGFAAISGSRKITTGKTGFLVFSLWAVWVLVKAGWAAVVG